MNKLFGEVCGAGLFGPGGRGFWGTQAGKNGLCHDMPNGVGFVPRYAKRCAKICRMAHRRINDLAMVLCQLMPNSTFLWQAA